ncbi:MAG: FG-GAP repeat protein [Planctomycetota bacterium]
MTCAAARSRPLRVVREHLSFEDEVMAPDEEIGNAFGYSVALRPEGLVVGAPLSIVDGVRTGGAHVFHPAGGDWLCTETLKARAPERRRLHRRVGEPGRRRRDGGIHAQPGQGVPIGHDLHMHARRLRSGPDPQLLRMR